jgi:hypothetical protein
MKAKSLKKEISYLFIPIMIGIFNKCVSMLYQKVCGILTDNENHEKKSHYDSAYLIKTLTFNIINTYFVFFHLIFYMNTFDKCPKHDCSKHLSAQLIAQFIGYYLATIKFEIIIP